MLATAAAGLLAAPPVAAMPRRYVLDREASVVGFNYILNGGRARGRMPVKSAEIMLDVDRPEKSHVEAVLDASHADAGLFFATDAMKSESVLDTKRYPEIRFVSKDIIGSIQGARVMGDLTIRDVTRPVTLKAVVYRQRGTEAGDRRRLSILLTGKIDRREFGASGFPQFVQPWVVLNILTRITLAEQ